MRKCPHRQLISPNSIGALNLIHSSKGTIEVLAEIQEERPDLISPTVDVNDYGLSRTWRRTSTSVALARGVDAQDIDFMNRWRTVENARGRRPVFQAMRDHYGDVRITSLDMSLRYTSAL